jgi:lactobin A/cerein 7B family class IIb bacteriocin
MSIENVKKFYEAVSKDASLKQKFVELSQKYQGQPMDETKAMAAMEQEGLPLAAQMGYSFTMDDLKAYSEEMKQPDISRELSDEELQAVVGGAGNVCVVLGVPANGTSGFCLMVGYLTYKNVFVGCILGGGFSYNEL